MSKKTAIIFIGIQASGKSTFYHERFKDYVHINLDTLHTRNKENILLQECVERGRSFVVDNTNPTREDREKYIRAAKDNGYCIHGYYFQSSVSDCIARNQKREGKARIPDHAVAGTHRKLELPEYKEGFDELFYVRMEGGSFIVDEWNEIEE
ncbi:MAG: AAA family ATPase [Lachnospiraceae bacterium]|nr:AAA family ATPase [Lachnospiraceae bacterium]